VKFYRIGMHSNLSFDNLMTLGKISYAYYSVVGPWISERPVCKACGWHWSNYGNPLQIQWDISTDQIGDFSWHGPFGVCPALIRKSLVRKFRTFGFECSYKKVTYIDHKRKRNIVPYPYSGPELVSFVPRHDVEIDMKASGVKLESHCDECGYEVYTPKTEGLVIRKKKWHGELIFYLAGDSEQGSLIYVTEEGRALIEQAGFTNIGFTEAGEIVK